MTNDTLALEKCIANDRPVHPETALNSFSPDQILGYPPNTRLVLGGFDPEEITADFLLAIHDLADEHRLSLESISVGQDRSLD